MKLLNLEWMTSVCKLGVPVCWGWYHKSLRSYKLEIIHLRSYKLEIIHLRSYKLEVIHLRSYIRDHINLRYKLRQEFIHSWTRYRKFNLHRQWPQTRSVKILQFLIEQKTSYHSVPWFMDLPWGHYQCGGHPDIQIIHMVGTFQKFPFVPMGVLTPCWRTLDGVSRPPIDTSGHFLANMFAKSPSNISPNPSEVISKVSQP